LSTNQQAEASTLGDGADSRLPTHGFAYWTGTMPGRVLGLVACISLFAMMLLTFSDVIGRYFFASPVPAAYELISLIMPLIIFCALPYVNLTQGHVTIDLLDGFIPASLRRWQMLIVHLISGMALALIAWRLAVAAQDHHEFDGVTNELYLPLWPFSTVMSVLCLIAAITMLIAGLHQWRGHSDIGKKA